MQRDLLVEVVNIVMLAASLLVQPFLVKADRTLLVDVVSRQARGPVPWRKEIEEGIRDSAKTVLFVDQAYLLSFNCLQVHPHQCRHIRLCPQFSVPPGFVLCSSVTIIDRRPDVPVTRRLAFVRLRRRERLRVYTTRHARRRFVFWAFRRSHGRARPSDLSVYC